MIISISTNYDLKWRIKGFENLAITSSGKIINTRTGKIKKRCVNGWSIGYWLDSNTFKRLEDINKIAIKKEILPF